MEKNIKTYRTHRALALFYGLASTIFIFFAFQLPQENPPMIFGVIFCLGISAVHFWVARGAKSSKKWARITSTIIAVLMLPGFPIGTLIGIYLIANAWKPWETEKSNLPFGVAPGR